MAIRFISRLISPILRLFDFLTPLGDLIARVWIAEIFFSSALTKIQSWQSTLSLFDSEYSVPLLPYHWAAYLGTGAELVLPIMLVIGLGGRITIFIFFVFNLVALYSYPFLWTEEGSVGFEQHVLWGMILMLLMFHGPGKLSLDYWLRKRYGHHLQ